MVKFNPENKESLTYGECLCPAMEITDKAEAQRYLTDYIAFIQTHLDKNPSPEGKTATQIALINIGYFAGYYDSATARRVNELFETTHPIFGNTYPTPEQALSAGMAAANK